MKKTIVTTVVALATCATSAFAADVNGSIEAGLENNNIAGNRAKAREYQDRSSHQGIVNFGLGLLSEDYYLELQGNSGFSLDKGAKHEERTDQNYLLKGGQYDSFKYSLFYTEIPHNITFGAQSIYQGTGSGVLFAPVLSGTPAPNSAANNAARRTATANLIAAERAAPRYFFDYSLERQHYGAGAEVSLKSPFFVSARAERIEVDGILPMGTYLTQEKEVPFPINHVTENLYLETGYRTKNLTVTLDGTLSSFHDKNNPLFLRFTDTSQFLSVPPPNEYYKVGGSFKYAMPFIKSTLMARGSHSQISNQQALFDPLATAGNLARYNGDINYTTASASLTSNPIPMLDTRVFLNYLDKKNESTTGLNYSTGGGTNLTEGFGYHKTNAGIDIGVRLPARTKVSFGYEYLNLIRGIREDAPQTFDHLAYVQVRNDLLSWLSAKVRYSRLYRESSFKQAVDPAGDAGTGYFRPYDAATKNQDAVKVGLEIVPLPNLAFGAEYTYKKDMYRDSIMGAQNEVRHELYFDANISAGIVRINPFINVEFDEQNSKHRVGNNLITAPGVPTAVTGPGGLTNPAYNWYNNAQTTYYALGLNSEITIIKDRLTAAIGGRYESSDGSERFSTDLSNPDIYNPIVNNNYLDTYIRKIVSAKLTAMLTKQLKAIVSYTFDDLKYTDDHYTGYDIFVSREAGGGYLLTGAYNAPSYTAHISYLALAYTF